MRDLHALLDTAGVGGPYLLVGFSFGGLLATMYAEANQERVEVYKTLDQAKALVAKVPDVPVTYMAAEPVSLPATWPVKKMQAFVLAKQTAFVRNFPKGRLVRVKPSHDIDLEQPERVLQEAERILSSP